MQILQFILDQCGKIIKNIVLVIKLNLSNYLYQYSNKKTYNIQEIIIGRIVK